jgi:hypothetical protein
MEIWRTSSWAIIWGYTINLYVIFNVDFLDIFTPFVHIVLQPGLISQANGSAYIETERTKIACAVFVLSFVLSYRSLHISTAREDTDPDNLKTQHIVKKVGSTSKSSMLPSLVDEGNLPCA